MHMARESDLDVPLLTGTATSNELAVREVVDRVVVSAARVIALLGLSFKTNTDDLRESPERRARRAAGRQGLRRAGLRPGVNPEHLIGENRAHLTARLPHLSRLLAPTPEEALAGADLAIVATAARPAVEALLAADLAGGPRPAPAGWAPR